MTVRGTAAPATATVRRRATTTAMATAGTSQRTETGTITSRLIARPTTTRTNRATTPTFITAGKSARGAQRAARPWRHERAETEEPCYQHGSFVVAQASGLELSAKLLERNRSFFRPQVQPGAAAIYAAVKAAAKTSCGGGNRKVAAEAGPPAAFVVHVEPGILRNAQQRRSFAVLNRHRIAQGLRADLGIGFIGFDFERSAQRHILELDHVLVCIDANRACG